MNWNNLNYKYLQGFSVNKSQLPSEASQEEDFFIIKIYKRMKYSHAWAAP